MQTVASRYQSPVTGDPSIVSGSHIAVRLDSGAVIVRDVELFSTMPTGRMGEVTTDTLREVAESTNRRIAQQQHPQIIMSHDDGEHPSLGRIAGPVHVARCQTTGLDTIYGDLEFNPGEFDTWVASNRYPRRSVEIAPSDKHIMNLALLGRNAPGAVLPDFKFSASDDAVCVVSPADTTFSRNGDEPMATPTLTEIITALEGATAEERAQFAALLTSDIPAETPASPAEPVTAPPPANTVQVDRAEFSALNNRLAQAQSRIDQMEAHNKRIEVDAKFRPVLAEMRNYGGFTTLDVDREMEQMHAFASDEQRDAHVTYIRENFKQDITGASLVAVRMPNAATPKPVSHDFSAAEVKQITTLCAEEKISYNAAAHRVNTEVATRLGIPTA